MHGDMKEGHSSFDGRNRFGGVSTPRDLRTSPFKTGKGVRVIFGREPNFPVHPSRLNSCTCNTFDRISSWIRPIYIYVVRNTSRAIKQFSPAYETERKRRKKIKRWSVVRYTRNPFRIESPTFLCLALSDDQSIRGSLGSIFRGRARESSLRRSRA